MVEDENEWIKKWLSLLTTLMRINKLQLKFFFHKSNNYIFLLFAFALIDSMTRSIFSKLPFMKSFQIFFSISIAGFSTMLFLALSHSPMASLTLCENFDTSVWADLISFRDSLEASSHCLLLSVKYWWPKLSHRKIHYIEVRYIHEVWVYLMVLTCDTNPWQNLLQQNSDLVSSLLPV